MIGERINPTGRKILAAEMGSRRLHPGRSGCPRAGGGRRPHARCQCRHPARRRARDTGASRAARAVGHGRAALHRLLHRRRAGGRPRRLQGQAARQFGHRRGRAPGVGAAAREEVRRGGGGNLQRRDRDLRGPGRALRGGEEDRAPRRRSRHPGIRRGGRSARDADRRHQQGVRPGDASAQAPTDGAEGEHDVRRLQHQLRAAGARRRQPRRF